MFRSIRWLRAQNFDWVIDLQCLARSGAFAWLANGKFLIGLDEVREGARGFYDLAVRRASFHTHAVDWYLAVLPHLGVPVHNHFQWLPERPQVAAEVKRKWLERSEFRTPTPNSELDCASARRALAEQTLAGGIFCRTRPAAGPKISRRAFRHSRRARKTSRSAKSFRALNRNAV